MFAWVIAKEGNFYLHSKYLTDLVSNAEHTQDRCFGETFY